MVNVQTNGEASPNPNLGSLPKNYDHRFPSALRLQILEEIVVSDTQGRKILMEHHDINQNNLGNWRTSIREGRLIPDPTKHPALSALYSKKTRKAPKPKVKAKARAQPKATLRKVQAKVKYDPALTKKPKLTAGAMLQDLLATVSAVEWENKALIDGLTRIQDLISSVLISLK